MALQIPNPSKIESVEVVNDAGAPIPVSGTLTVQDGGGAVSVDDNGGSLTMDTAQLPAALVGGRLDVVIGAALPAGANAIGKLAANSGVNVGDAGALLWTGAAYELQRAANVFKAFNGTSINAEATVWTPAANKKFRVMGLVVTSSVAGNIIFRDNTAGTIIAVIPIGAGGFAVPVDLGQGILSAAANNVLTAQGPATATLSGIIFGTEE